jgi:hypothetical protein
MAQIYVEMFTKKKDLHNQFKNDDRIWQINSTTSIRIDLETSKKRGNYTLYIFFCLFYPFARCHC